MAGSTGESWKRSADPVESVPSAKSPRVMEKLLEANTIFLHASYCVELDCTTPNCSRLREQIFHWRSCPNRANGSDSICAKMLKFVEAHKGFCRDDNCRFSFCPKSQQNGPQWVRLPSVPPVSPGGYVTRPSQNSPLDGSLAGPSGTFTSTRVTPPLNLSLGVEPVFHHPVTDRKAKAIQKRRTQRFAGQKLRTKVKVREKIVKADDNQSTEDQTTPVLVCMTKKRQKTDNISTERQKRGITHEENMQIPSHPRASVLPSHSCLVYIDPSDPFWQPRVVIDEASTVAFYN